MASRNTLKKGEGIYVVDICLFYLKTHFLILGPLYTGSPDITNRKRPNWEGKLRQVGGFRHFLSFSEQLISF